MASFLINGTNLPESRPAVHPCPELTASVGMPPERRERSQTTIPACEDRKPPCRKFWMIPKQMHRQCIFRQQEVWPSDRSHHVSRKVFPNPRSTTMTAPSTFLLSRRFPTLSHMFKTGSSTGVKSSAILRSMRTPRS